MPKDAKAALAALKPHFDKLPKAAPPYLSADWTKFRAEATKIVDGIGAAVEDSKIATARAAYATKKKELDALRTAINNAVGAQASKLSEARRALQQLNTIGTAIGQVVKDKSNEPKAAEIGRAIVNFSAYAQRELNSVEAPPKVD